MHILPPLPPLPPTPALRALLPGRLARARCPALLAAALALAPPAARAEGQVATASYLCGTETVAAAFTPGAVRLRLGGLYLDLAQTPAASGARYARAEDAETWAWFKGHEAALALWGETLPPCTKAPPEAAPLIARGNEPGWQARIGPERLEINHQDGTAEGWPLPAPQPVALANAEPGDSDAPGQRAYALPMQDVTLVLAMALCHDTMTGMPYPESATLKWRGQVLRGCAGAPEALLSAHAWRIWQVAGAALPEGLRADLVFDAQGRVFGASGCNRLAGSYALTGETLTFAPLRSTKMACAPEIMAIERVLLDVMGRIRGFDIDSDGGLVLRLPDGTAALRARR